VRASELSVEVGDGSVIGGRADSFRAAGTGPGRQRYLHEGGQDLPGGTATAALEVLGSQPVTELGRPVLDVSADVP
jgi:hypothetical protein